MFRREKRPQKGVVETVIGPTTSFRGHLRCDGGVRIDGLFEGTIETTGNVVIGEKAKVLADIVAQNVSISGAVKGNITARRVELLSTGHIWGDIKVASFLMDEGGFIRGQILMQTEKEPPLLEAPQPPKEEESSPPEAS